MIENALDPEERCYVQVVTPQASNELWSDALLRKKEVQNKNSKIRTWLDRQHKIKKERPSASAGRKERDGSFLASRKNKRTCQHILIQ